MKKFYFDLYVFNDKTNFLRSSSLAQKESSFGKKKTKVEAYQMSLLRNCNYKKLELFWN